MENLLKTYSNVDIKDLQDALINMKRYENDSSFDLGLCYDESYIDYYNYYYKVAYNEILSFSIKILENNERLTKKAIKEKIQEKYQENCKLKKIELELLKVIKF